MEHGLLAFIGGTGFDVQGEGSPFTSHQQQTIATRYGDVPLVTASHQGRPVVFLHRHGDPNGSSITVPPHRVNYRAQIAALKILGVTAIIATTAVGGLHADWPAGSLVLLDNFIDITTNRAKTFYDERAIHADMTYPYCERLRQLLVAGAAELNIPLNSKGVYLCADGPRFETAAEIALYARWGADVVGMTGATECMLAREAEISYAGVSIVTNVGAGIQQATLDHNEVVDVMHKTLPLLGRLYLYAARRYVDDPHTSSRQTVHGNITRDYDPIAAIVAAHKPHVGASDASQTCRQP